MLDYHSGSYTCSQEQLVVQYGRNAQQFCADRYEGGQKISAGVNKVSLTFTTEGRKDAGGFWLIYHGKKYFYRVETNLFHVNCMLS